jgi:hypothetical protein
MKKIIFLFAILFATMYCYSQDRIIKKDKSEIKAKVLEVGDIEIKYKKEDNPDGPTYAIKKADVNVIIYKNGQVESFNDIVAPTQIANINSTTPNNQNNTTQNNTINNSSKGFYIYKRVAVDKRRVTFYNELDRPIEKFKYANQAMEIFNKIPALQEDIKKFKTGRIVCGVGAGLAGIGMFYALYKIATVDGYDSFRDKTYILLAGGGLVTTLAGNLGLKMPAFKRLMANYNEGTKKAYGVNLNLKPTGVGLALNF